MRFGNQGGWIKVRLGVVGGEHERGAPPARHDIAHHQRAGAVIALDKQFGLSEYADTDPGSALARRFRSMELVPFDNVTNYASFLLVEPPFCGRKMRRSHPALLLIMTAEHDGIDLEEELEVP